MSREHQERDKWRAHCVTFKDEGRGKGEGDVVREGDLRGVEAANTVDVSVHKKK